MTTTEQIVTREEAISCAESYATAQTALDKIESHIAAKTAALNAKFEAERAELEQIKQECLEKLEAFTTENQDEVLGDARSTDFAGVKIGFRKSSAKLVTVGKKTWAHVMKALQSSPDLRQMYLKEELKIDKTALKKAEAEHLKKLGLRVDQEDKFFVKL